MSREDDVVNAREGLHLRRCLLTWISVCGLACLGLAQDAPASPDAAAIQADVEHAVAAYAAAVLEVAGAADPPPEVVVRNTPYLAHYSPQTNRIVIPYWPPEESTVAFFLALMDGDEALAEELFAELFDWFLVAHELTHWLMIARGFEVDHYMSEALANDGAVAFYNLYPESEERLLRLDILLAAALERLPDPTPPQLSPVTYFNAFYPSLAGTLPATGTTSSGSSATRLPAVTGSASLRSSRPCPPPRSTRSCSSHLPAEGAGRDGENERASRRSSAGRHAP